MNKTNLTLPSAITSTEAITTRSNGLSPSCCRPIRSRKTSHFTCLRCCYVPPLLSPALLSPFQWRSPIRDCVELDACGKANVPSSRRAVTKEVCHDFCALVRKSACVFRSPSIWHSPAEWADKPEKLHGHIRKMDEISM